MCGIIGAASHKVPNSESKLWSQVLHDLRHRGPDSSNYTISGEVFLGHTRLRVIDQSPEADQPMVSSDGRWHLVFNGEIYNFREIARKLNMSGSVTSDSRVLLESIAKLGVLETVRLVRGMFAIGIFDAKEEEFWLLRDQFGEKPLFYFNDSSHFAFSSEINGLITLLTGLGVSPKPNFDTFFSFMLQGFVYGEETVVQDLHRLSPSGYLRAKKVNDTWRKEVGRWADDWKVEANKEVPTDQALEQILSRAISGQLIADVPVGCFLSGGVDSSLLTLLAVEQMKSRSMHTFSIGFENESFDETQWAGIVASKLNTDHHKSVMTGEDALEMYLRRKDLKLDPLADPSILPTMFLSKEAKKFVTVALSGDGADELFGGYHRYLWFRRLTIASALPGARFLLQTASKLHEAHPIRSQILNARLDRLLTSSNQSTKIGRYMPLLSPGFPSHAIEKDRFAGIIRALNDQESTTGSGMDWARSFDVRNYLPGDILTKVDQASMAFSLEVRAPFLDKEVARIASKFPAKSLKSNGGKNVLKRLVARRLGNEFVNRPKMGFGPPLIEWLNGPLSLEVSASISAFDWESVGLNPQKIHALQLELIARRVSQGNFIWALTQFANSFSDLTQVNDNPR